MSIFELKSVNDGYCLTLSPQGHRAYRAALTGPDLNAVTTVCDAMGETLKFANFWRELATQWRGWSGTKSWESLEGDFELEAHSDSLGHVHIACAMTHGGPFGWRVSVSLSTEAGALDALASQAASFCEALDLAPVRDSR